MEKGSRQRSPRMLFDVTQVIGTVAEDANGMNTPGEAAFLLVAQHDAPGTFTWPLPDGSTCRVTVEHEHEVTQ